MRLWQLALVVALVATVPVASGAQRAAGDASGLDAALDAFSDEAKLRAENASVALSQDGSIAILGAPNEDSYRGAAWIFRKRGTTWAPTKLAPGRGATQFGQSVALSANGRIAVVGAPNDAKKGAAWVYRLIGGDTWVGSKVVPRGMDGEPSAGYSVAVSDDGSTVLVGGPGDDKRALVGVTGRGALWTFVRSGNTWKQSGKKLTPLRALGRSNFGWSVAISGDGSTALVGGPADNDENGAAWMYRRSGSKWLPVGAKIFFAQADKPVRRFKSRFGFSVALSSDGSTGVIGAPFEPKDNRAGAAYVVSRSGSSWARQTRLTAAGRQGRPQFGRAVTISGDGSTAVVGGPTDKQNRGAVWTFIRSGSTWAQDDAKLTRGTSFFGWSVGLSDGGGRLLVSGSERPAGIGFLLKNPPLVEGLDPDAGPTTGGTRVKIVGRGFTDVRRVTFGGVPASSYTVDSPLQITAVSPPRPAGGYDLIVWTSLTTSRAGGAARFTYAGQPAITQLAPASGPASGGTTVVITGTALTGASRVEFGGTPASFKVDGASQITAVAPPGQGTVPVTVTTPGGTSAAGQAARFTYSQTATVNFDNLVTGGPGQPLVTVSTQYAAQGVTFNNLSAIDYSKGAAIPGFARSGTNAVEGCVGQEICTSPLRAAFTSAKTMVRLWAGFSFPLSQPLQLQLRALNATGGLVGTAIATLPARQTPTPISVPLEVRAASASIVQVELSTSSGYTSAVAVDDVTFEGP